MINFPKSLTIDACEEVIKSIDESGSDEDLLLPVDTAKSAFGGLACAIQAVNSWGRKSKDRRLVLKETKETEIERIDEIIKRPHKLAAAMWAKSIFDGDFQSAELRGKINSAAKEAIEKQGASPIGQHLGRLCWFAFIDHSTKGFDRSFYIERPNSKHEPRQDLQIQSVIRSMFDKSLLVAGGGKPISGDDLNYLGRLFLELFLNTHEHGSRGMVRDEWIRPGIRTIYTNGINLTEEGTDGTLKGEQALTRYLEAQDSNSENMRRFVELSIVDSGLGYCGRWLADHPEMGSGNDLTIAQEYSIFKKCFTFRQTSSGRDEKGHGLPIVMDRLTKLKGFMRVRSGRLALYRDFISSPYSENDSCDFLDWASHAFAGEHQTVMPHAEGVAITLLIPLEAKR